MLTNYVNLFILWFFVFNLGLQSFKILDREKINTDMTNIRKIYQMENILISFRNIESKLQLMNIVNKINLDNFFVLYIYIYINTQIADGNK